MCAKATVEECANCGRPIGRLETPHIFKNQVVCAACNERLSNPPPVPRAAVAELPVAGEAMRCCPICGSTAKPKKKANGSTIVLLFLLLFFLLPGLLYWMLKGGYSYYCPKCGFKYGGAR